MTALTPERLAEIAEDSNRWGDLIEATRDELRAIIRMAETSSSLLAALKPFVSDHPITQFDFFIYREAARAAIAKAEGAR